MCVGQSVNLLSGKMYELLAKFPGWRTVLSSVAILVSTSLPVL